MTFGFGDYWITDAKATIRERSHDIFRLLQNAYWMDGRDEKVMGKAIENSQNFAVFENGTDKVIGYARVVTDYATFYYLCDVFVDEEYRRRGIGKTMLDWIILEEAKWNGLKGMLKTQDAMDLYRKYGFEECESVCMIRKNKDRT